LDFFGAAFLVLLEIRLRHPLFFLLCALTHL
jgi:hypothetical protein